MMFPLHPPSPLPPPPSPSDPMSCWRNEAMARMAAETAVRETAVAGGNLLGSRDLPDHYQQQVESRLRAMYLPRVSLPGLQPAGMMDAGAVHAAATTGMLGGSAPGPDISFASTPMSAATMPNLSAYAAAAAAAAAAASATAAAAYFQPSFGARSLSPLMSAAAFPAGAQRMDVGSGGGHGVGLPSYFVPYGSYQGVGPHGGDGAVPMSLGTSMNTCTMFEGVEGRKKQRGMENRSERMPPVFTQGGRVDASLPPFPYY